MKDARNFLYIFQIPKPFKLNDVAVCLLYSLFELISVQLDQFSNTTLFDWLKIIATKVNTNYKHTSVEK